MNQMDRWGPLATTNCIHLLTAAVVLEALVFAPPRRALLYEGGVMWVVMLIVYHALSRALSLSLSLSLSLCFLLPSVR